jgi:hypothetical protein
MANETSNDSIIKGTLQVNNGLKDVDVVTAIPVGSAIDPALLTTKQSLVGGINEVKTQANAFASMPANTFKANATGATADGQNVALAINQVL